MSTIEKTREICPQRILVADMATQDQAAGLRLYKGAITSSAPAAVLACNSDEGQ